MEVGVTFSPLQCEYLGVNYQEAFAWVCENYDPQIVRLGAYWNRIERVQGEFDVAELSWLIEKCIEQKRKIIVTVGMKAPRWPEYHMPDWVIKNLSEQENAAMTFVKTVVKYLMKYTDGILYIQLENEPFHRYEINGNRELSYDYLREIKKIVRESLPTKPAMLTCGISTTSWWEFQDFTALLNSLRLSDVIGLNVYVKIGVKNQEYLLPHRLYFLKLYLIKILGNFCGKKVLIAEMQDEPWEHGTHIHDETNTWRSWSENQSRNLLEKLKACGYVSVLRWGCEWHYKRSRITPASLC